jgi:hypothetical protein
LKTWQKILIPTLITLAIGGIYLFTVFKHRQDPGVAGQMQPAQELTADDVAIVRTESPQHFADVLDLQGKSVWMKNGYSMSYFPYAAGRVEFAKKVGVIPADQQLEIKSIIKAAVPAGVSDGVQHGSHQAMAVFALPGGKPQFATPIGYVDGNDEAYYTDVLFYYDDPHTIYSHWPKDTWAAIDAHQVKPGMSELQVRTAIGMKAQYDGQTEGDRTATYDVNGKHYTVAFVKNHATSIKSE